MWVWLSALIFLLLLWHTAAYAGTPGHDASVCWKEYISLARLQMSFIWRTSFCRYRKSMADNGHPTSQTVAQENVGMRLHVYTSTTHKMRCHIVTVLYIYSCCYRTPFNTGITFPRRSAAVSRIPLAYRLLYFAVVWRLMSEWMKKKTNITSYGTASSIQLERRV